MDIDINLICQSSKFSHYTFTKNYWFI